MNIFENVSRQDNALALLPLQTLHQLPIALKIKNMILNMVPKSLSGLAFAFLSS